MYVQANSTGRSRSRSLRSGSGLGAVPDSTLLAQVFAGQSGAPASSLVQQTVQQAMAQGSLWTKENCTGIVTPGSQIASAVLTTGGGIAMKLASVGGALAATPAAPFILAAAGVAELFGAIFGHHAAKVKQEQQIICAVVQSVNDTLSAMDQLVTSGQVPPQQAMQALDAIYPQIQQSVSPILKQDSSHCNAACFILAEARGVIAKKKAQYQDLIPPPPPPSPANSSGANPVASLAQSVGIPSSALWALGLLFLYEMI